MDSPGRSQSYLKQFMEEASNVKNGEVMNDEEYEGHEKSKYKSRKSRKSSNGEDVDGWVGDRKKSAGDRNENRNRVGGSSKYYGDEDDHGTRKESHFDKLKTKQEESTLEKLSNWYEDRDIKHDGGDKSSYDRVHSHLDESEKFIARKTASKLTNAEGSQVRSKSKDERLYDFDCEKVMDKDPRIPDRSENSRAKVHESSEHGNRRLEDSNTANNHEENSYLDKSDSRSRKRLGPKCETIRERSTSKLETHEGKSKALCSSSEKDKFSNVKEKNTDTDRVKKKSKHNIVEEDYKDGSVIRDEVSARKRSHKYKENRAIDSDGLEFRERSFNLEEGKSRREIGCSKRSRTPERSGSSSKRKEVDKEVYRDDRIKDRDDSQGDKNRDGDGSGENWKRMQPIINDRDEEWELSSRGCDMIDNERPLIRSGNRKDGRGEAVKASSKFGISTKNYDVIEIQRKPLDYPRNDDLIQSDLKSPPNDAQGLSSTGNASKDKYMYEGTPIEKVTTSNHQSTGQSSRSGSLPPVANEEPGSQGQPIQQGINGGRLVRPSRIRPNVRDNQQANIPVHFMGAPFSPLSILPPGPMQQINPAMSPAHPGVFMTPFSPPVWPGPPGLDMSMLPFSSGLSSTGFPQRFGPNMGNLPNPIMFFNQSGPERGMPISDSGFNAMVPQDKASGGWVPPHNKGIPGKAPSRGEQNDYSQNFVDTGIRPQNFIRELELTNVEDYPKLRELLQRKDEIVAKVASAPMYYKCDLQEFVLSPEFFGTKFDVILVDPPWEEYLHRAPGVTENMESWTVEDIMNLKIEAIADTPSFVFLWVGDGVGLEQGRQCLKKWGFRRCEDICWVKTNKNTATPALRHDSHTLFQHTKEHCLMGIKGTVRRSTDGHIIHANIDTDVIIAEEPPYGSTAKPDDMYRIIEHFALGCRRLELFGEDHNIRPGWLTLGKQLSTSNFNSEAYTRNFSDKDRKVWQGGGGRNPPPEAPHLVLTTPEIESLRPKSPMKNQQQLQQQSASISLTANSSNRKPAANPPHTPYHFGSSQEGSGVLVPPSRASGGRDMGNFGPRDNAFDVYGYGVPTPVVPLPNQELLEFDPQRTQNMMQR